MLVSALCLDVFITRIHFHFFLQIIQLASALQKFISKDTRLQSDKHVEVLIAAKAIEVNVVVMSISC